MTVMSDAVREMFASIAPTYDRVNTVLSFGVHHHWRRQAVRRSGARPGSRVLDCATGTGDLAFELFRAVQPGGAVSGVDFCPPMLVHGSHKALARGAKVAFLAGDVLRLPFRDDAFDVATIAFGIRNVDDPVAGLREMSRVVRPGGRLVVLEFGQPRGAFGAAYRLYSDRVLPLVGGWISGQRKAYRYLPRTAAAFPAGERFLDLMDEAGTFAARSAHPLTFGVCYLYVGTLR
jgi:demethylmenaquinone methyltransferase / 2-methoxy-6-polyprenyl-1,4-benzoquinol methylase